ncbi:MAG: hypothetical protein Q7J72_02620 [Candidatus Omnitrophota bacterium]|nr:hypothetical protein [Candidatus Omnitrophota bacterium]
MDMLKGVAVVIDNGIGEEENINKIIAKIRDRGIPTSEFKTLDSAKKCVHNFLAVNFIILDWKMTSVTADAPIGVQVGQVLDADTKQKNIDFIKNLKNYCFAPIFIFTNEVQADIESDILAKLREAGLYFDQEGKDYIYVRNKNDILQNDKLFTEIDQWINKTPSIYILKAWDKEFHQAKNEIFWDLYNKSNGSWPKVLWDHYEKEEEVPHVCINEVIFQLILSKVSLQGIEKEKVTKLSKDPDLKEVKDIFKRVMFQDGELCSGKLDGVRPGDIFKDGDKYFLNIRPECDTVQGRSGCDIIYLICGSKVPDTELKNLQNSQYGRSGLIPRINEEFLWLLDDGIVKFSFKEFEIRKFSELKDKRFCRLLSPYITNIQQRFSSFFGRFGIPRLPESVEKDILKISATITSPHSTVKCNT